jgi:hypothetical protein
MLALRSAVLIVPQLNAPLLMPCPPLLLLLPPQARGACVVVKAFIGVKASWV